MKKQYIARHDKAMRAVVQAFTKGRLGSYYLIADVGRLEGLKELGVHSKRVPAFVLPDRYLQNRGLDPQVERGFLQRGEVDSRSRMRPDDSGNDSIRTTHVSVSIQPSLLAKAHLYQQRAQTQPQAHQQAASQSPQQRRRQQQRARAKQAALQPPGWPQLQSLHTTFCPTVSVDRVLSSRGRVALTRPLDPVLDLGGQHSKAGVGHSVPVPTQVEAATHEVSPVTAPLHANGHAPAPASASAPTTASATASAPMSAPQLEDANMPQALPTSNCFRNTEIVDVDGFITHGYIIQGNGRFKVLNRDYMYVKALRG
ncbi:hypothetical protein ABBQ38_012992 [Trebouxia sp. C0009 RCD-2024]